MKLKHPLGPLGRMHVEDYHELIHMPAYTAVEALRRAGLPVDRDRVIQQMDRLEKDILRYQEQVIKEADKESFPIRYIGLHSLSPTPDEIFRAFLFSENRPTKIDRPPEAFLPLQSYGKSEKTDKPSADDGALLPYAAVGVNHRETDHPIVYAILKVRSLSKARGTHLAGFLNWRREDGAVHARMSWALENTTRLGASEPAVHQIPERSDPEVAKLVKSVIVPRVKPWLGNPDDWDPRKHGWCAKVDVRGAEAVIRAGCIARCRVSVPYLREGKDIHSKTASIFYKVPEGTYLKGTPQRDQVGKNGYFLLIFGGSWVALQMHIWDKARIWVPNEETQALHVSFFEGYPDLDVRYKTDTGLIFSQGYVEDLYGRRWNIPAPKGVYPGNSGRMYTFDKTLSDEERERTRRTFSHIQHIYANRPTQCTQGTTTLWWIALCHHGEYVQLQVPEYWADKGVPFPDAAGWQLNEGSGPGGKSFQAWTNNTVHDSGWFDGGPGTLEPAMMLIFRRAMGIPAPFLQDANMPWRVEAEVGPDMGHLREYNKVAKQFGLTPMPTW